MTKRSRLRVGLIGDPVAHSISPAMQQPAFDALGIAATYELWQTSAAELAARIASLREPGTLGANVTVPHKLAVMEYLDEVSTLARRAGAVNTIVSQNGRLSGDNTDVYGFATMLREACADVGAREAVVLGAGGAARAIVLALEQMGVRSITVANRGLERAEKLATELAPARIDLVGLGDAAFAHFLARCGILINATSLGWHPGEVPLDPALLEVLPEAAVVIDLTYRDTDLLRSARSCGLEALDGLAMLVHQGARALELWTGREPPLQIMMEAARRARTAWG